MKIERLLQCQGFGSRRECRALIVHGRVAVEGVPCADPEAEFSPEGVTFAVDGQPWRFYAQAYLVLNKPGGYEVSHKPQHHASVFSLLPIPLRVRGVQAVGRLDEDTTGLLLLSDDGQFIHAYSSPKKKVPKVYVATTRHPVSDAQIAQLLAGVQLHDEPAPIMAAACRRLGEMLLELTVTEGKYHLVKRMVAAAGNRVEALHRSSIGGLSLPEDLASGAWRWLTADDLKRLAGLPPCS